MEQWKYTYLEVHLITGRTHQIRAHLASIGYPIIGDYKYGSKKVNDRLKEQYGLKSQLLHAYRLEMPACTGELSNLSERKICGTTSKIVSELILKDRKIQ